MGIVSKLIGKTYLKTFGWESVGPMPEDLNKGVFIAAPHTSNWDLPLMLAVAFELEADLSWIGKHTLFEGPFGEFFKRLGGIPVDRRSRNNAVEQIAEEIRKRDRIFLSIAPEGTRSLTEYWKSGFYYIAKTANVPIICGFLDYKTKTGGVGRVIDSQRPIGVVMDEVREFYKDMQGYRQEWFGPIQLREEADEEPLERRPRAREEAAAAISPVGGSPASHAERIES